LARSLGWVAVGHFAPTNTQTLTPGSHDWGAPSAIQRTANGNGKPSDNTGIFPEGAETGCCVGGDAVGPSRLPCLRQGRQGKADQADAADRRGDVV